MDTKQLELSIAEGAYGEFATPNMEHAMMTKIMGPTLAEYEEMVLGAWAWSTDGSQQNAILFLNAESHCEFRSTGE